VGLLKRFANYADDKKLLGKLVPGSNPDDVDNVVWLVEQGLKGDSYVQGGLKKWLLARKNDVLQEVGVQLLGKAKEDKNVKEFFVGLLKRFANYADDKKLLGKLVPGSNPDDVDNVVWLVEQGLKGDSYVQGGLKKWLLARKNDVLQEVGVQLLGKAKEDKNVKKFFVGLLERFENYADEKKLLGKLVPGFNPETPKTVDALVRLVGDTSPAKPGMSSITSSTDNASSIPEHKANEPQIPVEVKMSGDPSHSPSTSNEKKQNKPNNPAQEAKDFVADWGKSSSEHAKLLRSVDGKFGDKLIQKAKEDDTVKKFSVGLLKTFNSYGYAEETELLGKLVPSSNLNNVDNVVWLLEQGLQGEYRAQEGAKRWLRARESDVLQKVLGRMSEKALEKADPWELAVPELVNKELDSKKVYEFLLNEKNENRGVGYVLGILKKEKFQELLGYSRETEERKVKVTELLKTNFDKLDSKIVEDSFYDEILKKVKEEVKTFLGTVLKEDDFESFKKGIDLRDQIFPVTLYALMTEEQKLRAPPNRRTPAEKVEMLAKGMNNLNKEGEKYMESLADKTIKKLGRIWLTDDDKRAISKTVELGRAIIDEQTQNIREIWEVLGSLTVNVLSSDSMVLNHLTKFYQTMRWPHGRV